MKSKIISPDLNKYPRIKKRKDKELYVLFTNHETGTVLHSDAPRYPVGWHSKDWITSAFEETDVDILVSNKN